MGYSKLDYDEYLNNNAYWLSKGIKAPKWAKELSEKPYNFPSVNAVDFYNDIFMDDLAEARPERDYITGEYSAIALERVEKINAKGQKSIKAKRTTVTKGNLELFNLIDESENFCMISAISYAGKRRTNSNARYMYALVIEVDNIYPGSGIHELVYSWNRSVAIMPRPTYVACSGFGVHLYYVFERPIPLFKNIFEQFSAAKTYLTKCFWNKYVTESYEKDKIQYESICQAFRCVGSITKDGQSYVMAFKTGDKYTIEQFNIFLPDNLKVNVIYKSNLTLKEARELYPEWYKRRIEEKKPRGHWERLQGIYYNWIEKIYNGAAVGHRYNCLENLCSLAVQCNISPEQVEKDCRELAQYLDSLTVDEKNHFTEYDILCALKTYHEAGLGAYTRKIEYISNKTGIELKRAKRNGRKRAKHIALMNFVREEINHNKDWRNKKGAPQKDKLILEWKQQNPDKTKADCRRELKLDPKTIRKWWDNEENESQGGENTQLNNI